MVKENVIELQNGKKLEVHPVDACRLLINTSSIAFLDIVKDEQKNVQSVSFEGDKMISVGDQVKVRVGVVDTIYNIVAIIIAKDKTSVMLFSSFVNKTTTYLLPLIGKTKQTLKFNSYFVNSFIDESLQYIGILYRFTGTQLYKEFEETIMKDKLYIKHIEYDPYHVMYVLRIPDEYHRDIENFLIGKYSQFSDNLKKRIISFHGINRDSFIYQVIYKSENLRRLMEKDLGSPIEKDSELSSVPVLDHEHYKMI